MSVEIIEGFDKRDWNGYLTPENAKKFGLVGIKVSQGRSWTPKDIAVLQRQWARANSIYGLARLPFHYLLSPWPGQDYEQYGRDQAKNIFNGIRTKFKNDYGELPPAIDVEHRFVGMAGGKARVALLRACLNKTEQLWDKAPLIYTRGGYWDKYIHPWVGDWEYWKEYELWEADPPPDTPIKGWVDGGVITQVALNLEYPGFPGIVDINETTQAWLDKHLKPEPPPVPPPTPVDCGPAQKAVLNQVVDFTKDLRDSL